MMVNGLASEVCVEEPLVVDLETRTWLPKYCRGDQQAFQQLLFAYRRPVYSYLARCGIDKTSRDDLFQEIFLKIHNAADSYQSSKPLSPWIFTIVVNTVRNYFRAERNREKVISIQQPPDLIDHGLSPDIKVENTHLIHWLEQEIHELPLPQREVLILTTIKGMRLKDVAKSLGIPVNTAKTCLRRARLKLIEKLNMHESTSKGEENAETM